MVYLHLATHSGVGGPTAAETDSGPFIGERSDVRSALERTDTAHETMTAVRERFAYSRTISPTYRESADDVQRVAFGYSKQ